VDIAQLAHAAEECILCREGWRRALPKRLLVGLGIKLCTKRGVYEIRKSTATILAVCKCIEQRSLSCRRRRCSREMLSTQARTYGAARRRRTAVRVFVGFDANYIQTARTGRHVAWQLLKPVRGRRRLDVMPPRRRRRPASFVVIDNDSCCAAFPLHAGCQCVKSIGNATHEHTLR